MAALMPLGKQQYFAASGAPLVGGKVYTYAAGTTSPLATYSDKAGVTPNTNPVILDSRGEATIFWGQAGYKVVLKDSADATIWTQDNLYAVQDSSSMTFAQQLITATAGQTVFNLSISYTNGTNSLAVYMNGLRLASTDYTETSTTSVTLNTGATVGDELLFVAGDYAASTTGADLVTYTPAGTGAVSTTVQTKLRESVSVKDFGAKGDGVTDDTAAIQAAITAAAGKPILLPAGTYKISGALTYNTTGLGNASGLKLYGDGKYKSIIDNRSGTNAIYCSSGTAAEFQYEVELCDFSIVNTTAVASTVGITLNGVRQSKIQSVRVVNQASHGMFIDGGASDNTACSQITLEDCDFSSNGGYGLICNASVGGINSTVTVKNTRVITNTLGGIASYSVTGLVVDGCAFAYNGGIGLIVGNAGVAYSKAARIENNEFDSNTGTQLQLGEVVGAYVVNNYFICNTAGGSVPAVTKQIDITTAAREVTIIQSIPRLAALYSGVTMFTVAAGASGVAILNTVWSSWVVTGNTKYTDAGTATLIVDDGYYLTPVRASSNVLFPSTQVPSTDANMLDDYREGTWTTTVTAQTNFTANPTLSVASYTKIGRLVYLNGQFDGTTVAAATATITFTLPFASTPTGLAGSFTGTAVEINSLVKGSIVDDTSADDTHAKIWMDSLAIAARTIKFSLVYLAAA